MLNDGRELTLVMAGVAIGIILLGSITLMTKSTYNDGTNTIARECDRNQEFTVDGYQYTCELIGQEN